MDFHNAFKELLRIASGIYKRFYLENTSCNVNFVGYIHALNLGNLPSKLVIDNVENLILKRSFV